MAWHSERTAGLSAAGPKSEWWACQLVVTLEINRCLLILPPQRPGRHGAADGAGDASADD